MFETHPATASPNSNFWYKVYHYEASKGFSNQFCKPDHKRVRKTKQRLTNRQTDRLDSKVEWELRMYPPPFPVTNVRKINIGLGIDNRCTSRAR